MREVIKDTGRFVALNVEETVNVGAKHRQLVESYTPIDLSEPATSI